MSHLKGIAFESEETQLQKLRERLRQMSDEELIKFRKTGLCFGENSMRYFRLASTWWRCRRVEGFRTMAERRRRAGLMKSVHKPAMIRSVLEEKSKLRRGVSIT